MAEVIIRYHKEQHYSTFFYPATGFFARVEESGYKEPFYSQEGPELIDISITNWCDRKCDICYRKSDQSGKHMSLESYITVIHQAKSMHVMQVALGGGNPNQHPYFCEILSRTRNEFGIVPNYTTNGRGLTPEVLKETKKNCGAVAVSAYYPYVETRKAINALTSYGIRANIHFILTNQSIDTATSWLKSPPDFLRKANAIIFLNYKPMGRLNDHSLLLSKRNDVNSFFRLATENPFEFRVGFDACSISGIAKFTKTPAICYDGCDAGRFSMFVSEKMKMYPCSFMAEAGYEGIAIEEYNMQDCWRRGKIFNDIRASLANNDCTKCFEFNSCLGGCPVFKEINLCIGT